MMFAFCLLPFGVGFGRGVGGKGVDLGNANFLTTAFFFRDPVAFFYRVARLVFFLFFPLFTIFSYKPAQELLMDSESAMEVFFLLFLLLSTNY